MEIGAELMFALKSLGSPCNPTPSHFPSLYLRFYLSFLSFIHPKNKIKSTFDHFPFFLFIIIISSNTYGLLS